MRSTSTLALCRRGIQTCKNACVASGFWAPCPAATPLALACRPMTSVQDAAATLMNKTHDFFLHIPKAGGTTIERLLPRSRTVIGLTRGFFKQTSKHQATRVIPWHVAPDVYLHLFKRSLPGPERFCLVREPAARYCSLVQWVNFSGPPWFSESSNAQLAHAFEGDRFNITWVRGPYLSQSPVQSVLCSRPRALALRRPSCVPPSPVTPAPSLPVPARYFCSLARDSCTLAPWPYCQPFLMQTATPSLQLLVAQPLLQPHSILTQPRSMLLLRCAESERWCTGSNPFCRTRSMSTSSRKPSLFGPRKAMSSVTA